MQKLLVIDDEPNIRFSVAQVFKQQGLRVLEAATAEEGLRLAADEAPDVVLLDIRLHGASGLDVFQELRKQDPKCLAIFITGYSTADTAIEAMKLGGFDYLVKPFDAEHLRSVVKQALDISRLVHVPAVVDQISRETEMSDRLIGSGPAMQGVCKQIGRVAAQEVNVLILGESGTGKELVARALFQHSHRNQAPFLAINCAAIPESLLESELFGHERGAFTGAERCRIGKFEQCNGGTLFLDEVGDMAPGTQAKILRMLQEGQFQRIGGNEILTADVRVIAATNQNLEEQIETGRFRKDLYYRLRGVTLHLPPLRERREDIAELAHYFLFRFNRQLGTTVQSISEEALDLLQTYHWPGNVRELQSVIRESLIVSVGPTILPGFLPAEIRRAPTADLSTTEPETEMSQLPVEGNDLSNLVQQVEVALAEDKRGIYRLALDEFDRWLVPRALKQAAGNQALTAEILGISRPTLRAKLRSLNLAIHKTVASAVTPKPPAGGES
ncbi:MAG: sigma-54-dependent Fis family transcriptional regulator [Planctomycetes bacterium]|nr:sigma-54-dependent Fis family transcriptional regulator [Planctomycetota bacterium]